MLFGPSPVPLLPTPSPQAIRQKGFPDCCRRCRPRASPVLSPHRFIDVSKKALRTKRLLALSNIMPVNQPPGCPLHAGGSPLCGPLLPATLPPHLCPALPLPLLLYSALEPPMPFHLLSDGFPWAPRCTLSIISHPSAASRTCFLSPPPLLQDSAAEPQATSHASSQLGSPKAQQASKPLVLPGPGPGGAPPRPNPARSQGSSALNIHDR